MSKLKTSFLIKFYLTDKARYKDFLKHLDLELIIYNIQNIVVSYFGYKILFIH